MRRKFWAFGALLLIGVGTFLVLHDRGPRSGEVQDEAKLAERDAASFPPPTRTTSTPWTMA